MVRRPPRSTLTDTLVPCSPLCRSGDGPTHYKPLRDKVAFELGIAPSTDVNPMTAVAEGAAVFAESIDWAAQNRGRKSARGAISAGGGLDLSFNYIART